MKRANISFFIPHRGCPFRCVFCDQKKISGKTAYVSGEDVRNTVQKALKTLRGRTAEIAFFGGSFTGIPIEEQEELLTVAYSFVQSGEVEGIRLSTRPDFIDAGTLLRLLNFGVTAVELGAQSMDDRVLQASGRGHSAADVARAARMIVESGISLGLQMMTGLPKATEKSDIQSAREMIALHPDTVRIYPTLVLSGTPLCERYQKGEYVPETLDEAVERAALLKEMFCRENIRVLRVGLHSEKSLEGSLVAGPYHPAFGEMVASRMFYHEFERYLKKEKPATVVLTAPAHLRSRVVGQRKENLKRIEDVFHIPCRMEEGENVTVNGVLIPT